MGMQENIAAAIRTVMERRQMSLSEFSEELGISRNALYDYIRCRGNPSIATVEHIAKKLGIAPASLVLGLLDTDQREITLLLLDTIEGVAELEEEKRQRFAELFLELVKLWNGD